MEGKRCSHEKGKGGGKGSMNAMGGGKGSMNAMGGGGGDEMKFLSRPRMEKKVEINK